MKLNPIGSNQMSTQQIINGWEKGVEPYKKRRITKHYDYLRQAESYQNRLYNRFDHVRLVDWPRFTNHGNYTWEVAFPTA